MPILVDIDSNGFNLSAAVYYFIFNIFFNIHSYTPITIITGLKYEIKISKTVHSIIFNPNFGQKSNVNIVID